MSPRLTVVDGERASAIRIATQRWAQARADAIAAAETACAAIEDAALQAREAASLSLLPPDVIETFRRLAERDLAEVQRARLMLGRAAR